MWAKARLHSTFIESGTANMKALKIAQNISVALATVGLLLPNAGVALARDVQAAAPLPASTAAPQIADVSLADGGVLQGQVLNAAGATQASADVLIHQGKDVVARTRTNPQGQFAVQGLKGGVYVVSTDGAAGVVRAWAPRTAPPSAKSGVLLVPDSQAVRAQLGNGGFINQYGGAALILGGLIAAIVWIAVDHNDDAS